MSLGEQQTFFVCEAHYEALDPTICPYCEAVEVRRLQELVDALKADNARLQALINALREMNYGLK